MIARYSRPEMEKIWNDESRFRIWLEIETLALEKMVEEGLAPAQALKDLKEKGAFEVARVLQIEEEVRHDVIAFLTNVAEHVGASARYVHRGMTSSDVLDTCLAVQLKRSGEMLISDMQRLCAALAKRAEEFKYTPCIGRTHGIHAEPVTFGLKLAGWYAEARRQEKRLRLAVEEVSCGKLSGAVGTHASVSPEVEAHVMKRLGLSAEPVSTQVVARDRHAFFFSVLAGIAGSLDRFATEIRHLQRTEVAEVHEKFSKGQKGSSAMPHKMNPILCENICGLARIVRSFAQPAFENVALWHERDISHSSAERVMGPDACIALDFMLNRFISIVEGMQINPQRMMKNLESSRGLIFSGTLLIALADSGISREDAYRLVQKHALPAWEGGADFSQRVLADSEITGRIAPEKLAEVFDLKRHFRYVDAIFKRALPDQ